MSLMKKLLLYRRFALSFQVYLLFAAREVNIKEIFIFYGVVLST